MRYNNLTDDELWRAIAQNTEATSALFYQQLEVDASLGANSPSGSAGVKRAYAGAANKFQREYLEYTTELRRRYNLV